MVGVVAGYLLTGCAAQRQQTEQLTAQVARLQDEVAGIQLNQRQIHQDLKRLHSESEAKLDSLDSKIDEVENAILSVKAKTDQFEVRRDGNTLNFTVPGGRQVSLANKQSRSSIGITAEDANRYLYNGEFYENGIRVLSVERDSRAERAGIRARDIIYRINGENIVDRKMFFERVYRHGDRTLMVELLRDGALQQVSIKPR